MKMRKFLAMLLTLSLVLSLSAPIALAVEIEDESTPAAGEPAEKETPEEEKNPDTSGGNEDKDPGTEPENPENPDGSEEKPPVTEPENPDGEKPPVTEPENPDGEKPPVTEPENPDGEKPPVTEPENPDGEKPPVTEPENPDGENPGETEEPPYFVDEEGNKVDKDGYLVDDEGNQILDENGNPVKAEDKDKIQGDLEDINKPPLTPEEQEALDELGGKADAITGETSREELEAIQNSPLYDRLTEEQKKAVEDALAALALLEQPVIPPVGGTLYERLMAAASLEEYDAIWNEAAADERNALTAEELAALEAHRAALEGVELPNRPDGAAFQQPFTPPVEYTKVAPLTKPKSQTVSRPVRARASSAYANGMDRSPLVKPEDEIADLVTNKTLENGVLTIEAYSKADVVPADIVLVLDQSLMMTYCVNCGQPIDQNGVGHYIKGTSCGCTLRFNDHSAFGGVVGVNTVRDLNWETDKRVTFDRKEGCTADRESHVFGPVWRSGSDQNGHSHIGRDGFVYKGDEKAVTFICEDYKNYGAKEYTTRQETLESAVNTFMEGIAEKNENLPEDSRHRVAVVTYNDSASTLRELSVVTNGNKTITFEKQSGGNKPVTGLQEAYTILGDSGSADRNKVVVFLTDGRPGETNVYQLGGNFGFLFVEGGVAFDVSDANNAVAKARELKENLGAVIYSVGIFNGADGKSAGTPWGTENVDKKDTNLIKPGSRPDYTWDDSTIDNANFMMNRISSSKTAGDGYYLSAATQDGLTSIFEQISNVIQPKVDLGPETIVRDTITPYFQVKGTATAKVVDIETEEEVSGYNLNVDPKDNEINVSGFDFSENYVIDRGGELDGKKLVITIPIERKPEFWGGNQVPTNVSSASGIYTEGGTCVKPLYTGDDSIASSTMNVPLLDVQLIPQDVNIYYSNPAPGADELHKGNNIRVQYAGAKDYIDVDYNKLTWQVDYAGLSTPAVLDPDTQKISNTEDGAYTVSRDVVPTKRGTVEKKTATFAGNEKANVNVFTPTVSFGDMRTYLTVEAPVEKHTPASVVWKHGSTVANSDENSMMTGDAPELKYTILGRVNALYGEGKNNAVRDYYAFVTEIDFGNGTKITHRNNDGTIAEGHDEHIVTFEHAACVDIHTQGFDAKTGEFLVHVFKPEITFTDVTTYKGTENDKVSFGEPVMERWVYPGTEVTLPNSGAPDIVYQYTPRESDLYEGAYYQKDTPVKVQVQINGREEYTPAGWSEPHNINECVTFKWEHLDCKLSNPNELENAEKVKDPHQLWVHVETCDLTVTKSVNRFYDGSGNDGFIFHIKGSGNPLAKTVDMDIFMGQKDDFKGSTEASKVISGLPVGKYTVTEDENWSWRYECTGGGEVELSASSSSGTASFTNTLTNDKWLSSEDVKVNTFNTRNPGATPQTLDDAGLPEERETGHNDEIPDGPETTD